MKGGENIDTKDNKFNLLRAKTVLDILDGDTNFGTVETDDKQNEIRVSMPYLKGERLCVISTKFGLPRTYSWNGGAMSRWKYLDELLDYCIQKHKTSDLLAFLFSKEQFMEKLKNHKPETIENAYSKIVNTVIQQINGVLYFGGNELVKVGEAFVIRETGKNITVAVPNFTRIDREYITDLSARAMKDVDDENCDSAITKARTLLEEVFCYVIERTGEKPSESGDIGKLYNQVKLLYNMHQDKDMDKRINSLLSGFEKILTAIAEMRNKSSDSHGVGAKRIGIASYHARLFVNASMTMADFILSVSENAMETKKESVKLQKEKKL